MVDQSPSADPVMNIALAGVLAPDAPQDARGLIQLMARDVPAVREKVLERLIALGILKRVEDRVLWVFSDRRYPKTADRAETQDARARLRATLLQQEIPEPRDALLLGLARAAGLLPQVFSAEELQRVQPWLELVTRIESLNRSLGSAVAHVRAARMGPG
jgi:hypothetical protein